MEAEGIQPGQSIENPALGLRSVILESTAEILRSEVEAEGTNGGPLHRHMRQEEFYPRWSLPRRNERWRGRRR